MIPDPIVKLEALDKVTTYLREGVDGAGVKVVVRQVRHNGCPLGDRRASTFQRSYFPKGQWPQESKCINPL